MHRSYAVRYVKYELMVCHKTLRISLTKEYGNIYTAEKKKRKKRRSREENKSWTISQLQSKTLNRRK